MMHKTSVNLWIESMFYSKSFDPTLYSVKDTAFILIYDTDLFTTCICKAFALFKLPCYFVLFRISKRDIHKIRDHKFGSLFKKHPEIIIILNIFIKPERVFDSFYFN